MGMAPWLSNREDVTAKRSERCETRRRESAKGVREVAINNGQKLPDAVVSLCGVYGIRLTDVIDYRVGDESVTVINAQGQKYTGELVKLNPPDYPAKVAANGAKATADGAKRRSSRSQKVLIDVPGKTR